MTRLNLDLNLRMAAWNTGPQHNLGLAQEAERLGYRCVWTEEAYGNDAAVPLAWIAAHTTSIQVGSAVWQIAGRSPATTAMTAATLDLFSDGRLRVGLGVSGPQVVEGWHGQPFSHPLQRTREYVEIVRRILRREGPVSFQGEQYSLPCRGGTGQGKPLKLILHPIRPQIPIYLGALGPRNVELCGEIGDGWLPIFMTPEALGGRFGDLLSAGLARSTLERQFDIAPTVHVVMGDDVDECRNQLRPRIALYIGGMGSKQKNFSNQLIGRLGFEADAAGVQQAYLSGDVAGAVSQVSDELVDAVALVGSKERIAERLSAWQESSATTLVIDTEDRQALRALAEIAL